MEVVEVLMSSDYNAGSKDSIEVDHIEPFFFYLIAVEIFLSLCGISVASNTVAISLSANDDRKSWPGVAAAATLWPYGIMNLKLGVVVLQ